MRRHQPLRQCAAFFPPELTPFEPLQTGLDRGRRLLNPGLFLQLALLALLAAFFPGAKLHAQTSTITGTVVDQSGAAIPGARVQIINQATGDLTREAMSDASGTFRALNLPTATYKVKVTASGMQELDRNEIVLDQVVVIFGADDAELTVGGDHVVHRNWRL